MVSSFLQKKIWWSNVSTKPTKGNQNKQRTNYILGQGLDTANFRNNFSPFYLIPGPSKNNQSLPSPTCHSYERYQDWVMDKIPDEILLRIFSFIHFTERIVLRMVSLRWSSLLYDYSLWKMFP